MLIVSFYTPDYEASAARLRTSCRASGQRFWVEPVAEEGTWIGNCAKKGAFVLRALRSASEPILWVDADAEVKRSLYVLEASLEGKDFAVFRDGKVNVDKLRFRSGTVYFGKSPASFALAQEWADRCHADPGIWDQAHLYHAWSESSDLTTTEWLSVSYCQVFDEDDGVSNPHIVHYQASRKFRKAKR